MSDRPTAPSAGPTQLKKYLVLGLVFVLWLASDLWTKHWADTQLADADHPLRVTATEADAGRPVVDLFAERLGLSDAEASAVAPHLRELPPAEPLAPDAPVFTASGPQANVRGFYVAWRGDELAPRRIFKSERVLLSRWLGWALPEADRGVIRKVVDEHVGTITAVQWLQTHLRRLSEEEAAQVAAAGLHPIRGGTANLSPGALAEAGRTYLLERRQVDVMGDWFKFLYAENPGAAFGFLKGLPARARDLIFLVLTVIVCLVIAGIIIKTPTHYTLVPLALTGVLAGAAGNFVDRVRYGYVIDFIDMDLGFMHWPTYNIADIAISVGVVLLIGDMLFNKDSALVTAPEETKA